MRENLYARKFLGLRYDDVINDVFASELKQIEQKHPAKITQWGYGETIHPSFWSGSSSEWKNMIGIKQSAVTWLTQTQQNSEIMLTQHLSPKNSEDDFLKTIFGFRFYVWKLA